MREDLGISLDDFRLLQEMQTREITPEDYELLMLLHSKSATQTLTQTALAQVTQVFRSDRMHADACAICLADFAESWIADEHGFEHSHHAEAVALAVAETPESMSVIQ